MWGLHLESKVRVSNSRVYNVVGGSTLYVRCEDVDLGIVKKFCLHEK